MNFTGNTKSLLLVHKDMPEQTLDESVNIVLTPQFYTLKREALPVKYAYQAKRIAASLFEGLLEDVSTHEYFVEKKGDSWLFIAYDLEKIQDFLVEKGFDLTLVSKMFFAEQMSEHLTSTVATGENEALVNFDGNLIMVPKTALADDVEYMEVHKDFTPKKGITLEAGEKSFLPKKESYILAGIFFLFAFFFVIEGLRYSGENTEEVEKIQSLLASYPALQSSYTRENIAKKYQSIDAKERKKRESIKAIAGMIFKGSTLSSFSMDSKKFQALFICTDAKIVKKVEALAKKENFSAQKVANSHEIKIEGSL